MLRTKNTCKLKDSRRLKIKVVTKMYQVNEMNKQINNNMDMRTEIGPKMLR